MAKRGPKPGQVKVRRLNTEERRIEVLKGRRAGETYAVIAKRLEVCRETVRQDYVAVLQERVKERTELAELVLQEELERLEELHHQAWAHAVVAEPPAGSPRAGRGSKQQRPDLFSMDRVLYIHDRKVKLLNLGLKDNSSEALLQRAPTLPLLSPREALSMVPRAWLKLDLIPEQLRPGDDPPVTLPSEAYLSALVQLIPIQWLDSEALPPALRILRAGSGVSTEGS